MVQGCGNKCVKYIFWIINFLFFVLGGVLVGLSLWARFDPSFIGIFTQTTKVDISRLPLDQFYYILYFLIVIGGIMLILGFLGCCGSACESMLVISVYLIVVVILLVIKIVAIILYFTNQTFLRDNIVNLIRSELVAKYSQQQAIQDVLNTIQNTWHCCGGGGCLDYGNYQQPLPMSCNCAANNNNVIGCGDYLFHMLQANLPVVLIITGVIMLVECFAIIFSFVICCAVKSKRGSY